MKLRKPFPVKRGTRRASMAVASLLLVSMLIQAVPAGHRATAEEADGQKIPLNASTLLSPARPLLSSGAQLAIQSMEAEFGLGPDPFLAGAGGGSASTAGGNQLVPFRNPAPSFSRNLLITRNLGYFPVQTEPSVAVDPTDPDHVVMATIDYNMGSVMSAYVSFDAGETWDGPNQVYRFREDFAAGGDPSLAFDQDGNLYVTSLSIGVREFVIGSIASQVAVLNIAVSKSTDGGLSWSDPALVSQGGTESVSQVEEETQRERGTVTFIDLDKPWIAIGPSVNDPAKQAIYVTYTEFKSLFTLIYADELAFLTEPILATQIKAVMSEDGGATWSEPVAVSPQVFSGFGVAAEEEAAIKGGNQAGSSATLSSRFVQGSFPQVGADGTLFVAYYDSTDDGGDEGLGTVQIGKSTDGGKTFEDPIIAGVYIDTTFRPRNAGFRSGGLPQMAVGPNNELYVVQTGRPTDKPADDGDVYFYRSLNGGATWEEPLRINQDDTDHYQFFPAIAVSPDGVVHIMWGDMRDDPVNLRYNIYYTRSTDQGATFGFELEGQDFTAPDTRVTDFPSNPEKAFPGGRFLGDYFGIAATEEEVFLVWADARLGEYGGFSQQIGFARKTAIEPPSLFLNPPSGSAGSVVTIQGFNFQPESTIQLYVSGVFTSVVLSDEQGQFTTSIYMPLTGEGPTEIRAFDDTGNVATASFYTEFGFDTLQDSLDAINQQLELQGQGGPQGNAQAEPEASPTPAG